MICHAIIYSNWYELTDTFWLQIWGYITDFDKIFCQ